ncbi:MAG: hypothetical protein ACYSTS_06615 [Planctomycetota bacterium]|jgi:hypothetical protein
MQMQFDAISLAMLLKNLFSGHIRYKLGGKATGKRDADWIEPAAINNLDCSGFVQYVIHETSRQYFKIPSGSVNQRDWFVNNNFLSINYSSEAPKHDNCVRIGFKDTIQAKLKTPTTPARKKQIGHVWFVINAKTYESTGRGGKAIGTKSLLWSDRTSDADDFFFLGTVPGFGMAKLAFD